MLKHYHNDPKISDRHALANSADPVLQESDQGLHCFSFHLDFLDKFSMEIPLCLNFR